MQPIFTTIGTKLPIMIIPDSQAHLDGHIVLTYTYSIYKDGGNKTKAHAQEKDAHLHLKQNNDPDYMGYITFEQPGHLFTYTSDGAEELNATEVEELIEIISHYRDTPGMWEL